METTQTETLKEELQPAAGLRNRLMRKRQEARNNTSDHKSTEEVLVEKLDKFLSSIESRLDVFDQYFKVSAEEAENESPKFLSPEPRSRSSSVSSITSLRIFSEANLNMIHQRLKVIKQSVLKTSFTNLDYLYKTLDDQYNYLFSTSSSPHIRDDEPAATSADHKEVLSRKIITTIQYFDEKLNQVEDLIEDRTHKAKIDYDKDAKFKYFRFYNFNKALKNSESRYLHYYELPLSWRENRYIIQGYRFSLQHRDMLKSIFHFNHNESMNIWSHLIGFMLIVYITFWHYPTTKAYELNTSTDNVGMYCFLVAAMKCLTSSSIWHTYSCFAKLPVRARCACVDYTGITVLITASVISAEYCSLYNYPRLLAFFVGFSSICGMTGFTFNWSPYFDKPECRSLRIGFFMGLAFLGLATFFCMCFFEGFIHSTLFFSPLLKSFIWYWVGVVFYGGLIPERWRYDVIVNEDATCTHSHTSEDVFTGNVEHSGIEELEEIETAIEEERIEERRERADIEKEREDLDGYESEEAYSLEKYKDIIDKHFPEQPTETPYHHDFMSLWWVDYAFSSHNLWHICVVLGIVGHYIALLEMYEAIER